MNGRPLIFCSVVALLLGCKARKWEEASGVLDESVPVEVMQCVTDDDVAWTAKTFRFEILTMQEQEGHDLVDFRLSEVTSKANAEPAESGSAFAGRGDRSEGGGYSLVFEGGALTLDSARLFDESDTPVVALGLLSLDFADVSLSGEQVTCSRVP